MKQVTIKQRVMAHKEYGVKLSSQETEQSAARKLSRVSHFSGKTIWSNKLK